jgi:hypothetical protein
VENLLAVALGDSASDSEFAQILQSYSPEVRAAAAQRRVK